MRSLLRAIGACVFALSLGVNALLLVRSSAGDPEPNHDIGAQRPETTPAPASECKDCEARLAACEASPKDEEIARASNPLLQILRSAERAPRPIPPRAVRMVSEVDAETQHAVLCDTATRKLREQWTAKKDEITRGLRSSLADTDEQERNVRSNAKKIADLLDLDPAEREQFERRYREVRLVVVQKAKAALERDPPDYEACLRHARELFAGEEQLAEEMLGPQGRTRLRAADLEARTVVLSILASLAELPFERALGW